MRFLLVANPRAGHGRARAAVEEILPRLESGGARFDLHWTQAPGDGAATVAATDLAPYDGVLAAGGDGTLYEVVNGVMAHADGEPPPLGILPVGTGNAFCRDLDLGDRPLETVVTRILSGQGRRVDVGRFRWGGRTNWFLNILGVGFVSDVTVTAHRLKRFGNLSYSLAVVLETIGLKSWPLILELDGERLERDGVFLEVANTRYTSNFLIAPEARFDDGLLDVILANRLGRIELLRAFPKVFTGAHVHHPRIEMRQARHLRVETSQEKLLSPDGEVVGTTPVEIDCLPGAMTLLA